MTPPPVPLRGDFPGGPLQSSMGVGRTAPPGRAFERLYRRHVEDVYRYAVAVLGNESDAEDVVQTTFLNAYRAYEDGTRPSRPDNWLIAIAHNVCRQRFRSAARRPREVELDPELVPIAEEEPRYQPEDIQRALTALTFQQRSALAMRELEGRSYKDIAAVLEVSESAVETLIFRARKAFREQLEGSLTCSEAEHALSRQLDGELPRKERGALRAHLRECEECATLARRFRAQRSALKGLVFLPLPSSLASFTGGGVAVGGTALGLKAVAIGSAIVVAAGAGTTELVRHSRPQPAKAASATRAPNVRHVASRPKQVAPMGRARTVPTPVATHPLPATRRNSPSGPPTSSRTVKPAAAPVAAKPVAASPAEASSSTPTPEAVPVESKPPKTAFPGHSGKAASGGSTTTEKSSPGRAKKKSEQPGQVTTSGQDGHPGNAGGNGNGRPDDPGKSNEEHGNGNGGVDETGNGNGSNGNGNGPPDDKGKPDDPELPVDPPEEIVTPVATVPVPDIPSDKKNKKDGPVSLSFG